MFGANETGLQEGKKAERLDKEVAAEQYSEIYAPVARWGWKPFCLGKILLFSN